MFELFFNTELTNIGTEEKLKHQLWTEIKSVYNEPSRHYHNLSHLDKLIAELEAIKNEISNWQTLVFSVAYHDIIYNILKHNNEEESAKFAYEKLTLLNLPDNQKDICVVQILATKNHDINNNSDTNYFTDADLSILGAGNDIYKIYTSQIREEYKYYPDFLYNPGRKKSIKPFLTNAQDL
ncbi:MAG: hypothetical protein ABI921_00110 [Panacibacter sp.]